MKKLLFLMLIFIFSCNIERPDNQNIINNKSIQSDTLKKHVPSDSLKKEEIKKDTIKPKPQNTPKPSNNGFYRHMRNIHRKCPVA